MSPPENRWILSDEVAARLFKIGILKLYRDGLRPFATCEDLAQDCLERCLSHFDPSRAVDFKAYYLQALRNAAINHRARIAPLPLDSIPELPGDDGRRLQRRLAIQKSIFTFRETLGETDRAVLDAACEVLAHLETSMTEDGNPHGLGSQGARAAGLTRDIFLRNWEKLRRRLRESLQRQLALTSEDWPEGWKD